MNCNCSIVVRVLWSTHFTVKFASTWNPFFPLLMQLYIVLAWLGLKRAALVKVPCHGLDRRIQMKCRSSPALLQTTLITICWNVIIDFCPMLSTAAQRTSIWPKRCSLFVHLQRKKGPRLTAYQSKIRSRHNSWIPITTRIPMSLNVSVRCFLLNGRCLLLRGCSMQGSRVCKSTRFIRGGRTE